jgi:hypothetical protein
MLECFRAKLWAGGAEQSAFHSEKKIKEKRKEQKDMSCVVKVYLGLIWQYLV